MINFDEEIKGPTTITEDPEDWSYRYTLKHLLGIREKLYDSYISATPLVCSARLKEINNKIRDAIKEANRHIRNTVLRTATGRWLMNIKGINYISAAYILSEFSINDDIVCPQQFINFAGYNRLPGMNYNHHANIIITMVVYSLAHADGIYSKIIQEAEKDKSSNKSKFKCGKVFLAHLFCQMYYEKYHKYYEPKYGNTIVEPEKPYRMY